MGNHNQSQNGESGRISRRSVVKTISTGTLLSGVGIVSGGKNTVEIGVDKNGDEVIRWKSVPEDWWHFEKHVLNVSDRVSQQVSDNPHVNGVGIGTENRMISGRKVSNVVLFTDERGDSGVDVPDVIDGVNIKEREIPNIMNFSSSLCHDSCYTQVAGGALLYDNNSPDMSKNSACTATTRVSHNGDPKLMTAGHTFGEANCDPDYSQKSYHCSNLKEVGKVYSSDINRSLDYALITPLNSSEVTSDEAVHWTVSTTLGVSGYVSQEGLHDMKSTGELAYKYGATTCRTSGLVEGYAKDLPSEFNVDCESSGVWVEIDLKADDGDSGAPMYRKWKDPEGCEWASMIAPLKGGENDDNNIKNIWGAAAYEITDNNIEFGAHWDPCGGTT